MTSPRICQGWSLLEELTAELSGRSLKVWARFVIRIGWRFGHHSRILQALDTQYAPALLKWMRGIMIRTAFTHTRITRLGVHHLCFQTQIVVVTKDIDVQRLTK